MTINEEDAVLSRPDPIPMEARFTLDGSDALENRLGQLCAEISESVQKIIPPADFEALLLGGGYGRGEGGVLRTPEGEDALYNDLEFYLLVRGQPVLNEHRYGAALHALCHRFSGEAGVEVEIKILSAAKLQAAAVSMFYYDLVTGHHWLAGDPKLLNTLLHHRAAHRIPLSEAARLLMNRCSGLLFAAERLRREPFGGEEADFVGRNIAKAQLAMGDVWLAANGQYHWSCRERHRRLEKVEESNRPPWFDQLLACHKLGRDFKLRPYRASADRSALLVSHHEIKRLASSVWLWLEGKRLGKSYDSVREYALDPVDKCPGTHALKNLLCQAKRFGPGVVMASAPWRYPRERLFNTLPILLWQNCHGDRFLLAFLQQQLRTGAENFPELVGAYESIWHSFN